MAKLHLLKIETKYFHSIKRGEKDFELRKNDRDFKVNDLVIFKEICGGVYTDLELPLVIIKYVLFGPAYGLSHDYCIFCWKRPGKKSRFCWKRPGKKSRQAI